MLTNQELRAIAQGCEEAEKTYGWALDGEGRAHVTHKNGAKILWSGIAPCFGGYQVMTDFYLLKNNIKFV